jgi:biotin-(acetyl-CoA carboxylase) ligase
MPTPTGSRIRSLYAETLNLPPPFKLVTLREVGDAFAHARQIAGPDSAGTLVYVGRFDLVEFALVLEPEEPLASARRVHYAAMAALADALAAHAPPEKPIAFDWPDAIRIDGGLIGGGRLAWPAGVEETAIPDWLVFGATIRTVAMGAGEPGLHPLSAALEDEGFDGMESARLVESFARHFMLALDAWYERGFDAVARDYLRYLPPESGKRRSIEENGDLAVRSVTGEAQQRALVPALLTPQWLDPATGGPRL